MSALKDAELEGFLPRLEAELKSKYTTFRVTHSRTRHRSENLPPRIQRLTNHTEYNEVQCDKRNSYRHRVKQEKAAAAADVDASKDGDDGAEAAHLYAQTNGTGNGHLEADDEVGRPAKKQKGLDGAVVNVDGDDEDDDDAVDFATC